MMKNDIKSPAILHYRTHLMGLAAIWIYLFHEWIPLAPNIPIIGFIENFIKQIGFFGVDISPSAIEKTAEKIKNLTEEKNY